MSSKRKSIITLARCCVFINEVLLLILTFLQMQVKMLLMPSPHPSHLPHLPQGTASSNTQNLPAPTADHPQDRTFFFFLQIPFLIQQVAKFLCLLLGDYQVKMSNPTEHRRTMISFLPLQMVHRHQPDLLNHDPAGLHRKSTTENPTVLTHHWKMLTQKLRNSWERVMPLKK